MNLELEIQLVAKPPVLPVEEDFRLWVAAALVNTKPQIELVIRIVDEQESRQLNRDFRGKNQPTNVLSFPFEAPPEVATPLLGGSGDLCAGGDRRGAATG